MDQNPDLQKYTIRACEKELASLRAQEETPETKIRIKNGEKLVRLLMDYHKDQILELEKDNKKGVYFYESNKNFYKLIGNSALIYAFEVAPGLGKKHVKLNFDTDSYKRQPDTWVCSVKVLPGAEEKFFQHIESMGLKKNEEKSTKSIFCFEFEKPYSDKHLIELDNRAMHDRRAVEEIVKPKNPLPNLCLAIEELIHEMKSVARTSQRNTPAEYDAFVKLFYFNCHKLRRDYQNYAIGWAGDLFQLASMLGTTRSNKAMLASFEITGIMSDRKILKIFSELDQIEKDIEAEARKVKSRSQSEFISPEELDEMFKRAQDLATHPEDDPAAGPAAEMGGDTEININDVVTPDVFQKQEVEQPEIFDQRPKGEDSEAGSKPVEKPKKASKTPKNEPKDKKQSK